MKEENAFGQGVDDAVNGRKHNAPDDCIGAYTVGYDLGLQAVEFGEYQPLTIEDDDEILFTFTDVLPGEKT